MTMDVCLVTVFGRHYQYENGSGWLGWFWGYEDAVVAQNFDCISVQGQSSTLLQLLLQQNQTST